MGKRKERSPVEQERRRKIRELLELSGVSSMTDIQELFKETIAEFMEDGLEAELSEALGYSKYDYKHKEEEKILSMYAKGMSTWDIEAHIRDIYGLAVLDTTVSRITDKVLPVTREWQQRPLESVYAVVFLDAIHYHVRSEGQVMKKAVYTAADEVSAWMPWRFLPSTGIRNIPRFPVPGG